MLPVRSSEWETLRRILARLWPQHRRQAALPEGEVPLLALVPEGPNRLALQTLLDKTSWALTLSEIVTAGRDSAIIIYDRELSPGGWRDTLRNLSGMSPRPYIILLSSRTDTNLWDEVQRTGGSDILRTPITSDALINALAKGRQIWLARQHLRQRGAIRQ